MLTVIVLPVACSSDWIMMTDAGTSTTSKTISIPGRTIALETPKHDASVWDKDSDKRLKAKLRRLDQSLTKSIFIFPRLYRNLLRIAQLMFYAELLAKIS